MKILILLKKEAGGVGSVIKYVAKEFRRREHIVDIISREDDMKIFSLIKSIFPIRKKIKNLMKKERYDIIYTQDWSLAFPLLFPTRLFKNKHLKINISAVSTEKIYSSQNFYKILLAICLVKN